MRNQVKELEGSDDSELLAAVREGNDAAFGELYRRHAGAGRAAARALTRSSADADDAVAEAFARVLAVMRRGGGPEVAMRPYLMTVVRNVCFDRGAARDRESLPGETDLMAAVDDLPTSYHTADLDHFTEANLVSRAFASLSDRWKHVLWQTDIEGRSPWELADELQLAPTAVAALAFRAREGLADAYLAAHVQHRPTAQCNREPSELARYVRNRMRSKEQVTFQAHLDQCNRCTEAVEELKVVSRPLRGLAWPALIGAPVITYGGKIIGVIRRVVTAQLVTTASAAAVTVATVGVATNQVPWEPFDALRPKAFVETQVADAPVGLGDAVVLPGEHTASSAPSTDAAMQDSGDNGGNERAAELPATTTIAPTVTAGAGSAVVAPSSTIAGIAGIPVSSVPAGATPTTSAPAATPLPDADVGPTPTAPTTPGTDGTTAPDQGTTDAGDGAPTAPTTTVPIPTGTIPGTGGGGMAGTPIGGSNTQSGTDDDESTSTTTTVPPTTTTTTPPETTVPDTTVPAPEEPPAEG